MRERKLRNLTQQLAGFEPMRSALYYCASTTTQELKDDFAQFQAIRKETAAKIVANVSVETDADADVVRLTSELLCLDCVFNQNRTEKLNDAVNSAAKILQDLLKKPVEQRSGLFSQHRRSICID